MTSKRSITKRVSQLRLVWHGHMWYEFCNFRVKVVGSTAYQQDSRHIAGNCTQFAVRPGLAHKGSNITPNTAQCLFRPQVQVYGTHFLPVGIDREVVAITDGRPEKCAGFLRGQRASAPRLHGITQKICRKFYPQGNATTQGNERHLPVGGVEVCSTP